MSTTTLTTPPTTTNRLTIEDRVTVPSLPVDGPRVSVVIPTLNEAPNLPAVFDRLPVGIWQLIIVDGRSTDDTIDVARRLRPDATIVTETRKGKGIALQTGFAAATGDIIVMLDADGSTDPAEIPLFVEALTNGADFAKGSRFLPGAGSSDITPLRRLGNTVLCAIANLGWGSRYTDLCYGYNAFWRHCLPTMDVDCAGFEVETLINIRIAAAKLDVAEVPSFEYDRIHGHSNLHPIRDGLRIARTLLRERLTPRRSTEAHLPTPPLVPRAA